MFTRLMSVVSLFLVAATVTTCGGHRPRAATVPLDPGRLASNA